MNEPVVANTEHAIVKDFPIITVTVRLLRVLTALCAWQGNRSIVQLQVDFRQHCGSHAQHKYSQKCGVHEDK